MTMPNLFAYWKLHAPVLGERNNFNLESQNEVSVSCTVL